MQYRERVANQQREAELLQPRMLPLMQSLKRKKKGAIITSDEAIQFLKSQDHQYRRVKEDTLREAVKKALDTIARHIFAHGGAGGGMVRRVPKSWSPPTAAEEGGSPLGSVVAKDFLTKLPKPFPSGKGSDRYWSQREQKEDEPSLEKTDVVGPISLLLCDHATLNERCADAAKEGEFLEAHKYQQQTLGISLAMCGMASMAAADVALQAVKISTRAIEVAEITSRKMKLELKLGKLIAGPWDNFAVECDFASCAELQAEIRNLRALIDGPQEPTSHYTAADDGRRGSEADPADPESRVSSSDGGTKRRRSKVSEKKKSRWSDRKDKVADEMYQHAMGGWH